MSHVTTINTGDAVINRLDVLQRAVESLGGVWKQDQTTYHSWQVRHGQSAGNRLPPGYSSASACSHAIGLPNPSSEYERYEIGVLEDKQSPGQYHLSYDPYGGKLDQRFGRGLQGLVSEYHRHLVLSEAQAVGDQYLSEQRLEDGSIVLEFDTTMRIGI